MQVKSAQERRKLVFPFLQWAFGLLWAILLELVHLQHAESAPTATTLLASRPLLRVLHDASCAQLLERLLRAFVTCRVRIVWPVAACDPQVIRDWMLLPPTQVRSESTGSCHV